MRAFVLCFFLTALTLRLFSQTGVQLPPTVAIARGEKIYPLDEASRIKIIRKAENAEIKYTPVGFQFETTQSTAKILIPQTFDTTALIEQCLIYYSCLGSEDAMRREILMVYPFFEPLEKPAPVVVRYSGNGRFNVKIDHWETIPRPGTPTPLEAEIYNFVLDQSFSGSQSFETIPDEVFETVAKENDIDPSVVKEFYQKVLLWQKSQ